MLPCCNVLKDCVSHLKPVWEVSDKSLANKAQDFLLGSLTLQQMLGWQVAIVAMHTD